MYTQVLLNEPEHLFRHRHRLEDNEIGDHGAHVLAEVLPRCALRTLKSVGEGSDYSVCVEGLVCAYFGQCR